MVTSKFTSESRRSSYLELPALLLLDTPLKWLGRFWMGQTYLVVVCQDERHKTQVPDSAYENASQAMQWEDAIPMAAHYLP